MAEIKLISVGELIENKYKFFIPSYQRGYRWTKLEVKKLLEDIYNFDNNIDGDFYCLQPLVVKKDNEGNRWRVIDAQQRLTTIYLILRCLEKEKFIISYERGGEIENAFSDEKTSNPSIEDYYLQSNYNTIVKWFKNQDNKKFFANLKQTMFIWYDIDIINGADELAMFRNLNSGKIPLTNAELVKALFLKNMGESDSEKDLAQNIIAEEYDQIERKMREPEFWYFLTREAPRTSCIELLFDLMLTTDNVLEEGKRREIESVGKNKTFYYFDWKVIYTKEGQRADAQTQFQQAKNLWEDVQKYFHTLEGWYSDAETYNLIGFINAFKGGGLKDIYNLYTDSDNKCEFKEKLKNKCLSICGINTDESSLSYDELRNWLKSLRYDDDTKEVSKRILLMANIATLNLQNTKKDADKHGSDGTVPNVLSNKIFSKVKFSFASYHSCKWEIEHISPNNAVVSEALKATEIWRKLGDIKENEHLKDLKGQIADDDWAELDKYVAVEDDSIMTLPNLTLLTKRDNIKVSNHSFVEKRSQIMNFVSEGSFVPPCSLMVFTKGFSYKKADKTEKEMVDFWSQSDREVYLNEIFSVINQYFQCVNKDK
ncbi:MAG: DUF262 domain-containing protein [Bacteroidales bacterium]|nr:DUF262 domain-containing protein [Bacteroidales bacterium]